MKTSLFQYELPPDRIAQQPSDRRDSSRLLHLPRRRGKPWHGSFRDLPGRLRPGDILVLNDTRVRPARLVGRREATGGRVELLLVRRNGDAWHALGKAGGKVRDGEALRFGRLRGRLLGRTATGEWRVALEASEEDLGRLGSLPLPPYILRPDGPTPRDRRRYQTVFAEPEGSVAAPTAGLHFTRSLLGRLGRAGVEIRRLTLHVGPGTFRPIRSDRVEEHAMDPEPYAIPAATARAVERARAAGRRVIAVGTTTTRALEAFARDGRRRAETDLFIRPPFEFRLVDGMITNFHLPGSTLVCLVAAFAGRKRILRTYEEAAGAGYRFYSYGDAMLIL